MQKKPKKFMWIFDDPSNYVEPQSTQNGEQYSTNTARTEETPAVEPEIDEPSDPDLIISLLSAIWINAKKHPLTVFAIVAGIATYSSVSIATTSKEYGKIYALTWLPVFFCLHVLFEGASVIFYANSSKDIAQKRNYFKTIIQNFIRLMMFIYSLCWRTAVWSMPLLILAGISGASTLEKSTGANDAHFYSARTAASLGFIVFFNSIFCYYFTKYLTVVPEILLNDKNNQDAMERSQKVTRRDFRALYIVCYVPTIIFSLVNYLFLGDSRFVTSPPQKHPHLLLAVAANTFMGALYVYQNFIKTEYYIRNVARSEKGTMQTR